LNAYQKQQEAISNFKLQAELGGIQDRADGRSQTLDGVGNVVSGLGGLIKGFNQNKYGKEITGLQGFGTDQASLVPGIDKFVTLDGSPSPTTPVFGDAWLTGGRMV
jgi:hypothetical protein